MRAVLFSLLLLVGACAATPDEVTTGHPGVAPDSLDAIARQVEVARGRPLPPGTATLVISNQLVDLVLAGEVSVYEILTTIISNLLLPCSTISVAHVSVLREDLGVFKDHFHSVFSHVC